MTLKRKKTNYPGVYVANGTNAATGRPEKIYYIRYRLKSADGSWTEHTETAGRQYRDNMTPAKASHVRAKKMNGDQLPNRERRAKAKAAKLKRSWTVAALWEEYQRANPDLKNYASDHSLYNRYIGPAFGEKKPKEILALDIDRLKLRQLKDKSPQTQAHALELLRRIINFGIKRGLSQGPGFTISLPRVSNEKTEDLTPEQLASLVHVIDEQIKYKSPYRWGAYMMRLALLTGMRRGEMFRLNWDDIDWHRNNVALRDAKSGRDEIIPMSSYAASLLNTIRGEGQASPVVFPGKDGGQRTTIVRQVNKIKEFAELLTDFRALHGLRHVFASGLISNGISFDIVSRLLCHKGRHVTHRYAHLRDDALRHAAELAGSLIKQDSELIELAHH
ncbi:MAG: tyrosine-type recombinase/integrase [Propionibacteriaceae bacterium]